MVETDSKTDQAPRRLTLSNILRMMITRPAMQSSVMIARSPSGQTHFEVTVVPDDTTTVREAEAQAVSIFDRLQVSYPSSVESDNTTVSLSRNAKGETQIEVTLRANDRMPTIDDVADETVRVYDRMRAGYPMANGYTAKPGSVAS